MTQLGNTAATKIAERLAALADREFTQLAEFASTCDAQSSAGLVIEACRCLDHANVVQSLAPPEHGQLPYQDFDLLHRGWNTFAGLLLPRSGGFAGIPLRESTPELRRVMKAMLYSAGRHSVLRKASEMLRHGYITASVEGTHISLRLSEGTATDFFHDSADQQRLADLAHKLLKDYRPLPADPQLIASLRADMAKLVFAWRTPHGTMVGYGAEPHIDDYFLHAVTENALFWSDEAGLHPEAELGDAPGAAVRATVLALMSFYLKHIMFVEEGLKKLEGVNPYMSLTIWKQPDELCASLGLATGMPERMTKAALDFITVKPSDGAYLLRAGSPWIPMLIEISEGFLLSPVSSIFRNPFHGIRMFRETVSPRVRHAFAEHREKWMMEELYSLFRGSRFETISQPVRIRRRGTLVTDIDAAIYDRQADEMVLFQLKWQDFSTSDLKVQRSKAKNFRDQVEKWARNTLDWIDEFGTEALLRTLKIRGQANASDTKVRLIAIGRTSARFRSYGYEIRMPGVRSLPWSQLVRLRHAIGNSPDFFAVLDERAQVESMTPVSRLAMPYELDLGDAKVTFEDIWGQVPQSGDNG